MGLLQTIPEWRGEGCARACINNLNKDKDQKEKEAQLAATRSKLFSIFGGEAEELECSCKGFQPIP